MPALSWSSKKTLLDLARHSIRTHLEEGMDPDFTPDLPELFLLRGCFVTLHKDSELRGCVGTFDVTKPLYQNVIRMAAAAALQDSRFPAVTKHELPELSIEVSVLGEMQKVDSISEIEIGRHGIYVRLGNRTGTFLPQVAVEENWSIADFVMFCAREKAGLTPEECAQAEIFRYEVEKMKEEER